MKQSTIALALLPLLFTPVTKARTPEMPVLENRAAQGDITAPGGARRLTGDQTAALRDSLSDKPAKNIILLFGWVSYQTATKLAEHKRRLQVMSTRDGMTGVYNRRHWETMLRNEFDNCRRHNRDATLLIIDIDHFKSINDTWGHDVGDEAIVALTRQLQITLRGSDVIGRFGGDEFAVIMSGTPAESAITAMLRVHEGLNTLRLPNTPQVTLRISVGVAPLNPQMSHYREWLKSADLALYKAKKAGRNRTEVAA